MDYMDEKKIFEIIEKNKEKQVDSYVNAIKKLVKNNEKYYKDKKYAENFKEKQDKVFNSHKIDKSIGNEQKYENSGIKKTIL